MSNEPMEIPKFCKDCDFYSFRTTDAGHGFNHVAICTSPDNTIVKYDLVSGESTRKYNTAIEAREAKFVDYVSCCGVSARWFKDRTQEVMKRQEVRAAENGSSKSKSGSFVPGIDL